MWNTRDTLPQHICQGNFVYTTITLFSVQILAAVRNKYSRKETSSGPISGTLCHKPLELHYWICAYSPLILHCRDLCQQSSNTLIGAGVCLVCICWKFQIHIPSTQFKQSPSFFECPFLKVSLPQGRLWTSRLITTDSFITLCSVSSGFLLEEPLACCDGGGRLASALVHRLHREADRQD